MEPFERLECRAIRLGDAILALAVKVLWAGVVAAWLFVILHEFLRGL